jgi:hypothetical protein
MADESITIYAYDDQLNWLGQREGDGTELQEGESLLPYIVVYGFDAGSKELTTTKVVRNDYKVSDTETTTAPTPGLYTPITWDGKQWQGTDEATYQARVDAEVAQYLADHPVEMTDDQKALAALTLQVAQQAETNTQQSQINAQLLLATAQATANGGTTND